MVRRPARARARARSGRGRHEPIRVGDVTIYVSDRSDGTYAVEARSPGGRQGFTAKDSPALVQLVARLVREAEARVPVTMEAAVTAYIDHLRAKGRRPGTLSEAGYRLRPLERLVDYVQDFRRTHVEQRLAGGGRRDSAAKARREAGEDLDPPSVATSKGTLARIRDACGYWRERGWLRRDPTEGMVVDGSTPAGKEALTRAEAERLADYLLGRDDDAALGLLLCLWLGLREGEVRLAQVRALYLDGDPPIWQVRRDTTKTDRGVRTLPLPALLAARLVRRIHERPFAAPVFPRSRKPVDDRPHVGGWLRQAAEHACGQAGVPYACPQALRDTHAQLALVHGAAVDAVSVGLGHEDQATTVKSYISEAVVEAARAASVTQLRAPGRRRGKSSVVDQ